MEDKKLKKVVIALITVLLVCTLAACGSTNEKEPDQSITFVDGKLVNMNDTEYVGIFFDYTNVSECILGAVLPCLPACSCHKHSMLINSLSACNFTSHLSSDSFCTETEL